MGDSRAQVKIEFSIYGRDFKQSWSINWTPDYHAGHAVDERVAQWFTDCYNEAHGEYLLDGMREQQRRDAEEAERKERSEYERLHAKYGTRDGDGGRDG